jgi:hypothetical protein
MPVSKVESLSVRFVAAVDKTRKPFKMIFDRADKNRNGVLEPSEIDVMLHDGIDFWISPADRNVLLEIMDPKQTNRISHQQLIERIDFRKKGIAQYLVSQHDFLAAVTKVWYERYASQWATVRSLLSTANFEEMLTHLRETKPKITDHQAAILYADKLSGSEDSLYEHMVQLELLEADPITLLDYNPKRRRTAVGTSPPKKNRSKKK